jgi:hypothetical protein
MPDDLETKQEGVTIFSIAMDGKYYLSVKKDERIQEETEKDYLMDEYVGVIKRLWRDYIAQGKEPALIGVPVTDFALVQETLHCIAPDMFYAPHGEKLPRNREKLLHWLMAEKPRIGARISKDALEYLVINLDEISDLNLERKKERDKNKVFYF